MHKLLIAALLFLLSFATSSQAEDLRLNKLEDDIDFLMQAYKAVGLSVAVVEKDQVIYLDGFGHRDLKRKKDVDENTIFPIASASKAFTAALLGTLEAEGKLSLKDKVAEHLEGLEFHTPEMNAAITIEDLLSHKSGLGGLDGSLVLFPTDEHAEIVARLRYLKPEGVVKGSNIYSNMGYTLAGGIVEAVSSHSWQENLQTRIFAPLNMTNSSTNSQYQQSSNNYALGYGVSEGETEAALFENYYAYAAAGGIRSSAKDLANWMLAWLNQGQFEGKQILPAEYIKKARSIHNSRPADYEPSNFLNAEGLGWRLEANNGDFKVFHGGNTSGFTSLVLTFPFKGLGIAVLVNQQNSILPYILADVIKNRMFESEKVPLSDYPVIVGDIYKPSVISQGLNTNKPPKLKLKSYAGTYLHKGYGKVRISLEDKNLYAHYPSYKFLLVHDEDNVFWMSPTEKISHFNPEFALSFKLSEKQEVTSFTIGLQASGPVEFKKQ